MTGFMDKMKNKAKSASGDPQARFEELQQKHKDGKLDNQGRAEMERLKKQFSRKNK